jgi:hypothetical protein
MGMKPSPYSSVWQYYWAEEFSRGDPSVLTNPIGHDTVILNLPSLESYDLCLPKVIKWNSLANGMAGDVITFCRRRHQDCWLLEGKLPCGP